MSKIDKPLPSPEVLMESSAQLVQYIALGELVEKEVKEARARHTEMLKRVHDATGSKSWEARYKGERLANLTLAFNAESFSVEKPAEVIEWLKENGLEKYLHVEFHERVVIEEHTTETVAEAFTKGLSHKDGVTYIDGTPVPEGFVKHVPGGTRVSRLSVTKKDIKAIQRALSDPENPALQRAAGFEVPQIEGSDEAPVEGEVVDEPKSKIDKFPWE